MVYLITGVTGQIGHALQNLLKDEAKGISRQQLDFSEPEKIKIKLKEFSPRIIINTAAYTAVDKAEEEEKLAYKINAEAVGQMAEYAFENNITFVHYSTDYVYPGDRKTPWKEDDKTAPLSVYGRSKLAGDESIKKTAEKFENAKWLIFRTSWVYAAEGKNFVNTMLRLGREKEVLSVVSDQIGAPSYAYEIASATVEALKKSEEMKNFPSGIYHLCNRGETSWHGFAEEIYRIANDLGAELKVREVKEIKTADYKTAALRPLNSRLDSTKLSSVFKIIMPSWQDALSRCLLERYRLEKEESEKREASEN